MKKLRVLNVILLMSGLLTVAVPAQAQIAADSLTFQCFDIVVDDRIDGAIGEEQIYVTVSPYKDGEQALFTFRNVGPEASVIAEIYFDDGALLGIAQLLENPPYVDFSPYRVRPRNLPEGREVVPHIVASVGFFAVDAGRRAPRRGVGPGEEVGIIFDLKRDKTYEDVISGLLRDYEGPDDLAFFHESIRIGIHVIAFASGRSESFICAPKPATAITLASFTAQTEGDDVMLAWKTGTETDNAGFNLYRAASADGPWTKVNDALIAAQGDPVSGASYSFVDAPGYGTFHYLLEDVDFYGVTTRHGPASATLGLGFRRPIHRPTLPVY